MSRQGMEHGKTCQLSESMVETISSLQNTRVKHLVRLRDSGHRRRQKRFLVEGQRELERAVACSWPLETVYYCESLFGGDPAQALLEAARKSGAEMVRMAEPPFLKCAYRQSPDGFLAVAMWRERQLEDLVLSPEALLVVLEGIEKPGNLGAILRTADGTGAAGLILVDPRTDPYNPNAIRASQGAFFSLPFIEAEADALRHFLAAEGFAPVLTAPDGERLLWEADLRGRKALFLGAEDEGLSPQWRAFGPAWRLPMQGVTDSLNVSAMAAMVLYEAARQRQEDFSS